MKTSKEQKYWYQIDIYECVMCGKERKYKYRVSKKPEFPIEVKLYACPTHFI